jgi:hypothetical protein
VRVALGATLAVVLGCVDTQFEAPEPPLPCSAEVASVNAAEALVWIRVDLAENGYRYCSAVAISPRLLLTAYSCVAYPGDLDREATTDAGDARSPVARQTYRDPADYQAFCDRSEVWTDIENGSFRSRLSAPVPVADIGVGLTGNIDRPTLGVEALIAAGSSSRCNESVAVLSLSEELDVFALPLRLDDSAEVGEPILTSGIVASEGKFVRRDGAGLVQRVTRERGDESIPPQSLLLEASSCYLSRGGPVLAQTSGALVALVAWGQSAACDAGASDTTIAIRLAPYRALLLETAASYGQTLFTERRISSDVEIPCDASR